MPETLGPYELIARLGAGGMASVYRARDTRDGRFVALKVLHDHRTGGDQVRLFQQEARLTTRLDHPNIVRVFEAGEADGQPYLAMEIVEGDTLASALARRRRLPPDEVRRIAIAIASALDEAHGHKIIHRDIKPGNVLLGFDGSIKVSDFGIARAMDTTTQTATGTFLGSVLYASPEAIEGRTDRRGDLYSLGVVLYQCLLGHPPFEAQTAPAVMRMHERDRPPDLDRLRAIDQDLGAIIERLLQKDPDDRFQSAAHLLRALGADAGGRRGGRALWLAGGAGLALAIAATAIALVFLLGGEGGKVEPTPTVTMNTATATPTSAPTMTPTPGFLQIWGAMADAANWGYDVLARAWTRVGARAPSPTPTPTPAPTVVPQVRLRSLTPEVNQETVASQPIVGVIEYTLPVGTAVTIEVYVRPPLGDVTRAGQATETTVTPRGQISLSISYAVSGAEVCGYVVRTEVTEPFRGGNCVPE